MAERSMLWTTNGTGHGVASGYASDRWQAFVKKLFTSDQAASACVLNGVDNELAVSGTASPVSVAAGAAIDHSFFYENDAPLNLAVATPSVGTTGGAVVLEANWAAQTVTAKAIRNTDGVAAIPTPTQVANTTWQVQIATFIITVGGVITLTDVRKRAKFSNHVYANSFDSSAVDNSTIALSGGALQVKASGVTATQLAAAVAGNGLSGGAGTALAVNVDNSTLEINTDALRVKDLGIVTAKLANDAVDDTKVGNRVPQFYRRQGGDASSWVVGGTASQTPGMVRMQAGTAIVTFASSATSNTYVLTFPTAFSQPPLVFISAATANGFFAHKINSTLPAATGLQFSLREVTGAVLNTTVETFWLAIGTE